MKNPNGYGSVVKLSGNRRKPYMARVTVGYNDNGTPIYKALDYFASRTDALICLANYNDEQYNLDFRDLTFSQLFDKLKEIEYPQLKDSLKYTLNAAYKHCRTLHGIKYRLIKKYQMQRCIDNCGLSYATQTNIRNLFYHLDRLAFDLDIITKRYSETLTVKTATPKIRNVFTDDEVKKLWQSRSLPGVDSVLFMLYTGFRISEMLSIRCENIDLDSETIKGGMKTAAGTDRIVPIHSAILQLVKDNMKSEKLFPISKPGFERQLALAMSQLGMSHTSHECRHTFRSKLDSAGANKVCIDQIIGHRSADVGERVYTHKTIDELKEAIEKLSYGL